ncbi:hypothetical protein GCM10027361_12410 [Erwinia aphidicola]
MALPAIHTGTGMPDAVCDTALTSLNTSDIALSNFSERLPHAGATDPWWCLTAAPLRISLAG